MLRGMIGKSMAVITLLALAGPLMAQQQGQTVNAFKMFFWADDIPGLIMIWALVLMSVATVALIIQHMMANKASQIIPKQNLGEYEALLADKRFRDAIEKAAGDPSMLGKMLHASLAEAPNGYGAMERAIEEVGDLESSRRSRKLEMLNVMGATGPMIGLFGTVYGMILAFYTIVEKGGQPQPADLAAGIATALVTTIWGLVVGIPAVAAVSLIRAKIDELTVEAMVQTETLIGQFSPSKRSASPGAAAATAAATPPPAAPVTSAAPRPRPA